MGTVLLYVGNCMSYEVHRIIITDDEEMIASAIEDYRNNLGWDNMVWQVYDDPQTIDTRDFQFNNYLVSITSKLLGDAA